eukprot:TRINITY_DN4931_c0_g1_i8.p1 TRINITY_DN4931_c0_g1~~TRINITY_DN4931_c0_g1_i8.p1  ORF type:complete len:414 (+),score=37.09 TRINITY_DN4931_c0_g1_i8:206-1447(+)
MHVVDPDTKTRKYDWVVYKQHDAQFVNFDLTFESIISRVPHDAHMILTATMPSVIVDTAVMFRNSPEGRALIQEIIDVQLEMHRCAAPGMAAIMETILRHKSRMHGCVYNRECAKLCEGQPDTLAGNYGTTSLLKCFVKHTHNCGMWNWHFEQVDIPEIWVMPGNDDFTLKHNLPPLADDISSFGNGPARRMENDEDFFSIFWGQPWIVDRPNPATHPEFWQRFPTCLMLHTGGGGRHNPQGHHVAAVSMSKFPPQCYEMREIHVEPNQAFDSNLARKNSWVIKVQTFSPPWPCDFDMAKHLAVTCVREQSYFHVGPLLKIVSGVQSAADCATHCGKTQECAVWTWSREAKFQLPAQECFLRRDTSRSPFRLSGMVSGSARACSVEGRQIQLAQLTCKQRQRRRERNLTMVRT